MTEIPNAALGSDDRRIGRPSASHARAVLRIVVMLLTVAAALWMLYALRGVILLILLSMLFAYVVVPLVDFVCRPITWGDATRAVPRPVAIAAVYLGLFSSLGIASY